MNSVSRHLVSCDTAAPCLTDNTAESNVTVYGLSTEARRVLLSEPDLAHVQNCTSFTFLWLHSRETRIVNIGAKIALTQFRVRSKFKPHHHR